METKHILLFFLYLGTISSRVFAAGEDSTSRSGYFITRENNRLIGYVVKRFKSSSFMSCSQSCLRNAWCSSTNFEVSSEKDAKGTCELNKHSCSLIDENTELYEQQRATFSLLLKLSDSGTWYQVLVETGTMQYAGTNASVYIRIEGTAGYIEKQLHNEEDNFEKGSQDTFIFQGKDYIGALRSVSIKRDKSGKHDGWYLETISVARSTREDGFKKGLYNAYGIQCSYNDWVEAHKWIQLKNE